MVLSLRQVLMRMPEADANTRDDRGQTKLMVAADAGDAAMVATLLACGADVNRSSRKGTTAVIFAVWRSDPATLQLLVDAGADLTVRCCTLTHPTLRNTVGWCLVLRQGCAGSALLTRPARLCQPRSFRKAAPLSHLVCLLPPSLSFPAQRLTQSMGLTRRGCGWTLGSDSQFGYTLPMWAVQNKDMKILAILLAGGADVRAKDTLGMDVMKLAKQLNFTEACAMLQQALDQTPLSDDP